MTVSSVLLSLSLFEIDTFSLLSHHMSMHACSDWNPTMKAKLIYLKLCNAGISKC
jgi:hypothetical protein